MRLSDLNDQLDALIDKYIAKKSKLSKGQATGNPDKTELPYRSGNQYTPVANRRHRKFLGMDQGGRDEAKPSNLA